MHVLITKFCPRSTLFVVGYGFIWIINIGLQVRTGPLSGTFSIIWPTVGNWHAYPVALVNVSPPTTLQGSLIIETFVSAALLAVITLACVAKITSLGPGLTSWSVIMRGWTSCTSYWDRIFSIPAKGMTSRRTDTGSTSVT